MTTVPSGWDAYVEGHNGGTAYHRSAAVLIGARAFGLRTWFLISRGSQDDIVGVLPLIEQSSLLFGRFLISVPFFNYGGILANSNAIAIALAEHAAGLARQRQARHVELRHTAAISGLELQERIDKVSMLLALPSTEEQLAKQLGSKLRSQIKRAEREQPEVVWGGAELLPEFYSVFSASMHELGTPVYSRGFFDTVADALKDVFSVIVVRVCGRAQAVAVTIQHGTRMEVPWAAASPDAKKSALNMRLYWEMLRYSVGRGATVFDFGRSTVGAGTYRFKEQWGAKPLQLRWHYWLRDGAAIPMLNQSNPKYALAAKLWRRMPLPCANVVGPYIVRNLP